MSRTRRRSEGNGQFAVKSEDVTQKDIIRPPISVRATYIGMAAVIVLCFVLGVAFSPAVGGKIICAVFGILFMGLAARFGRIALVLTVDRAIVRGIFRTRSVPRDAITQWWDSSSLEWTDETGVSRSTPVSAVKLGYTRRRADGSMEPSSQSRRIEEWVEASQKRASD